MPFFQSFNKPKTKIKKKLFNLTITKMLLLKLHHFLALFGSYNILIILRTILERHSRLYLKATSLAIIKPTFTFTCNMKIKTESRFRHP